MMQKQVCKVTRAIIFSGVVALIFGCQAQTRITGSPSNPVVSATASSENIQTGLDVASTVQQWLSAQKTTGSVAISYRGAPVVKQGFGRSPDTPYPVASLSKAITAICMQQLLNARQRPATLTLGQATPELLQQYPPADTRLAGVTLAQLMAHNSGIHSRYHSDYIADNRAFTLFDMNPQFDALSREPLANTPGSGYHYSNANYLLLGLAIEEMTRQPYEEYCNNTTLKPAGIVADINPQWRVMSSWGGWRISATDYLKFLNHYFLDTTAPGRQHKKHNVGTDVGRGASYTHGTFTRQTNNGPRFWHAGSWLWKKNFTTEQFGAYFFTREDGMMVSVNYATSAQGETLLDLQQRLEVALDL